MNKMASRIGRTLLALVIIGGVALSGTGGTLSRAQDASSSTSAPRVIFSSPAQREVTGPDAALQFVFDQPMNRASVEAAFQIDPPVNGTLSWLDDATLAFDPTGPLERGALFRVTIDSSAQSSEGLPMDDSFRLDFEIAPNLSVNQVIPAPGAENVEAGATITVVFDRPVVPLVVTGAQSDLPQPLTLSPAVEGTGEWVGTAIYVFRPAQALAGSTLYTATVSDDLSDVDGSPMTGPYTWQFRTIPPQILSTEPYTNASQVPLEQVVRLYFNQPMDPDSTRGAFTLRNENTGSDVAGTLSYENDNSVLVFSPSSPLQLETTYQAVILGTAKSASGEGPLSNPQTVLFSTVPYPRVVSTSPFNGETVQPYQGIWIQFNAPMDRQSFTGKVHVDPEPEDLSISPNGDYLGINFAMQPDTMYTITLDAGVTDVYGNPIKEATVFSFTTTSYQPALHVAMRGDIAFTSAYRPDTRLLAVSTNITTFNGRLGLCRPGAIQAAAHQPRMDAVRRRAAQQGDELPHQPEQRVGWAACAWHLLYGIRLP
jgi:hypothetical protein